MFISYSLYVYVYAFGFVGRGRGSESKPIPLLACAWCDIRYSYVCHSDRVRSCVCAPDNELLVLSASGVVAGYNELLLVSVSLSLNFNSLLANGFYGYVCGSAYAAYGYAGAAAHAQLFTFLVLPFTCGLERVGTSPAASGMYTREYSCFCDKGPPHINDGYVNTVSI